jgi:acyl-coenzyme A thioesterase PaaI-like protein
MTYQPNSFHCFVCGVKNESGLRARFQNDGPGRVRVETRICEQHQGYPGIAHGGVLAALLDEAMGRVLLTEDDQRFFFTAKMELRYKSNVPLDTDLIISGRLLKDRGRTATVEGDITLPDGTRAVEATATMFQIPPEDVQLDVDALGWRIYNDEEFEAMIADE